MFCLRGDNGTTQSFAMMRHEKWAPLIVLYHTQLTVHAAGSGVAKSAALVANKKTPSWKQFLGRIYDGPGTHKP